LGRARKKAKGGALEASKLVHGERLRRARRATRGGDVLTRKETHKTRSLRLALSIKNEDARVSLQLIFKQRVERKNNHALKGGDWTKGGSDRNLGMARQ